MLATDSNEIQKKIYDNKNCWKNEHIWVQWLNLCELTLRVRKSIPFVEIEIGERMLLNKSTDYRPRISDLQLQIKTNHRGFIETLTIHGNKKRSNNAISVPLPFCFIQC